MSEIVEKPLPAVRLAARVQTVPSQPEVGPVVGPAFDAVADALRSVSASLATPIAEYAWTDAGMRVTVGYAYDGDPVDGVEIVELPAVERALCTTHLGSMAGIADSWMALHDDIATRGLIGSAPGREHYIRADSEDQSDWITELQQPVAAA